MAWITDLGEFLWAVITNWAAYTTGGIVIALITLWSTLRQVPLSRKIFIAVALVFLFFAFFNAWREQKNEATKANQMVADLTLSRITGEIQFGILGQQGSGSQAAIIVELKNTSAPSGIVPASWHLTAIGPDGNKHQGWANTLKDKNLDFCFGPNKLMRFVRADALYLKTEPPIGRNESKQGVLWFGLPTLPAPQLNNSDTSLLLEADTVSGQHISFTITIGQLKERSSRPTIFFSGIENSSMLDLPCKENQPY